MPGLSSDAEDELLAWIEAAQPVTRLCEISLSARCDDESPDAAGVPKGPAGKVSRPSQLTYGELPLRQLKSAVAKIREHGGLVAQGGCRFFDLGCGGGKLVLAAAVLLEPLTSHLDVVGIEVVDSLIAEAETLRAQCTAKLCVAGETGLAAAVAEARFVCGDVLDEATVAAGVDWAQDETATASSTPRCTIVVVNGLCFPSAVLASICERLLRQQDLCNATTGCSCELSERFVLSTSPLPWESSAAKNVGAQSPSADIAESYCPPGGEADRAEVPRVAAPQPPLNLRANYHYQKDSILC